MEVSAKFLTASAPGRCNPRHWSDIQHGAATLFGVPRCQFIYRRDSCLGLGHLLRTVHHDCDVRTRNVSLPATTTCTRFLAEPLAKANNIAMRLDTISPLNPGAEQAAKNRRWLKATRRVNTWRRDLSALGTAVEAHLRHDLARSGDVGSLPDGRSGSCRLHRLNNIRPR